MWVQFHSSSPFAIKVFIGGVNVVSDETAIETPETLLRRLNLLQEKASIQDYVVSPGQVWLDGIANTDNSVRQFVAMAFGSGYSVEAQFSGQKLVGGVQFEVVPSKLVVEPGAVRLQPRGVALKPPGTVHFELVVKNLNGETITFVVSNLYTVDELKDLIEKKEHTRHITSDSSSPVDSWRNNVRWQTTTSDQTRSCTSSSGYAVVARLKHRWA